MIDGMIVEDPMEGDFTGTVNQNAIQEMSVISGTFNAEYGQAMSAIVNLVTKDGGEDFSGHLEYISDQLNDFKYHQRYAFGHVLDSNYTHINLREKLLDYYSEASSIYPNSLIPLLDLPISGSLSTNISGSLGTSKLNYFGSFLYKTDENPLPHGVDIRQDSQLKLTYAISPRLKLAGHIHSSAWLYQNYSHRWKYRPENQAHNFKTHDRFTLKFTHSLSEALFYSLAISRSNVGTRQAVQDKPLDSYEKPLTDESVYFYSSGDQGIFTDNLTKTSSLNYNMTYQANKQHLLESGFTLSRHWLDIHHEEQPWPDGANFVDDTTFTPIQGSFYLQDKIELDYIILNLGLRYDYLDPASGMWENISQFGTLDEDGNFTPAKIVEADPSSKWSPRIGIAYPLSDRTVFHFSYGHFFQSPNFNAITYNARKDVSATLALVGNPHIKPQKTVSFETGLKQALSRDMSLEVTAWMKDIHDLLSTVQVKYLSRDYVVYENSDYASVKGIDLSISKRQGQNLAGSVNYTLSVAKGNNSEPLGGYFSAYFQEEIPHQEYFLDFDQRHDISIDLNYNTPVNSGMEIFGWFPFSGVNTNILINAASGLPYTPYVDPTFRVDVNSARKPWTYSVDLRMKKRVAVGRMSVTGFLEVINLTDHKNVLTVFSKTGKPFDSGESGSVGSSEDANHNPAAVGPGRTIKFGTTLEF
ncbi:MAG: TonB-dependent receptor [FCB group bacterium]|nr:TonB-dependent receptor [FCB group bacterium]